MREEICFEVSAKSSKGFVKKTQPILDEMREKSYYLDNISYKNDEQIILHFKPLEANIICSQKTGE